MSLDQELEQMEASLRDLAPILSTYRKSLLLAGFSNEESFQLVMALQKSLLTRPQQSKEG